MPWYSCHLYRQPLSQTFTSHWKDERLNPLITHLLFNILIKQQLCWVFSLTTIERNDDCDELCRFGRTKPRKWFWRWDRPSRWRTRWLWGRAAVWTTGALTDTRGRAQSTRSPVSRRRIPSPLSRRPTTRTRVPTRSTRSKWTAASRRWATARRPLVAHPSSPATTCERLITTITALLILAIRRVYAA